MYWSWFDAIGDFDGDGLNDIVGNRVVLQRCL
jgi:hypothetical protein